MHPLPFNYKTKDRIPLLSFFLNLQCQGSISSVQFISVAQSCPTLCNPMNRSMPGLPVHHQFPEFTQTHVHRASDAIQPSHPLSSPSPPAPNPSQHQSLFQGVNSSHEVAKVLEFQLEHHSFQRNPRADLQNGLVGCPCSQRDSQESSPTPQFNITPLPAFIHHLTASYTPAYSCMSLHALMLFMPSHILAHSHTSVHAFTCLCMPSLPLHAFTWPHIPFHVLTCSHKSSHSFQTSCTLAHPSMFLHILTHL